MWRDFLDAAHEGYASILHTVLVSSAHLNDAALALPDALGYEVG